MSFNNFLQKNTELSERFQHPNSLDLLLERFNENNRILENKEFTVDSQKSTVIFVLGPSGVGKDSLIQDIEPLNLFNFAKTATSRERRLDEGESENSYVWMRGRREHEDLATYISNLVKEYDLIEYREKNGSLYGLPKVSLLSSTNQPILIRTGVKGAKLLVDNYSKEFNFLSIFLVPDSFEQLWNRIKDRGNCEERMIEALEFIEKSKEFINYYILNSELPDNISNLTGFEISKISLIKLLSSNIR